jgi:hypothetical protein
MRAEKKAVVARFSSGSRLDLSTLGLEKPAAYEVKPVPETVGSVEDSVKA